MLISTYERGLFIFRLTSEDMMDAKRYGASNQIIYLLANRTLTLWNLDGTDGASEIMAPFRRARFLMEVDGVWQSYQSGMPLPSCIRVEIENSDAEPVAGVPGTSRSEIEAPPEGIASQAYRFLQAQADKTRTSPRLSA